LDASTRKSLPANTGNDTEHWFIRETLYSRLLAGSGEAARSPLLPFLEYPVLTREQRKVVELLVDRFASHEFV
jgi:hypothetical protein